MPCFYCGKRISVVRQMADQDFCSDEHRRRYQDLGDAILRRLSESDSRPASRTVHGSARHPAAAATVAPPPPRSRPNSAAEVIIPPETGAIQGHRPVPSGIVSAFIGVTADAVFSAPDANPPDLGVSVAQPQAPASSLFLRSPAPGPGAAGASYAPPVFAPSFESRPAAFGGFAIRRRCTVGARSFGFFPIEPGIRPRFVRHRSATAPRVPSRFPAIPNLPAPPACDALPPAAFGAIPHVHAPATPLISAPSAGVFEPLAATPPRFPGRSLAPSAPVSAAIQPVAASRLCEWRITLPAPQTRTAAAVALQHFSALAAAPVLPDLAPCTRIRGAIGESGLLLNTAPPLSLRSRQFARSAAACDSWPVPADSRVPVLAAKRLTLGGDPRATGAMRLAVPAPLLGGVSRLAVAAPPLAQWSMRMPGGVPFERIAGVRVYGWLRQPMPDARKRAAVGSDLLPPPILTVAAAFPGLIAEAVSRTCGPSAFLVTLPGVVGPPLSNRRPATELPLSGAAPSWPPFTVAAARRRLPPPAHLATPALSLRTMPSIRLSAEPGMQLTGIRFVIRPARPKFRALAPGEALPLAPQPARVISRYLPGTGGDMYRSAVLPSTPSGVCSSTPPVAPASIAVVRPHAGGTASRVWDFLERPFRPAVPPRFEGAVESGIRMADLAPFERRSLHGFAASFLPTLPAPPIRGAGIQVPRSDLPGALAQTLPPPSVTPISAPATPMQIASSARSAESGFSAAVQLLSPGAAAWPARTLAPGGLLPYAFGPVSMRHTAEAAAAEMPLRVPQVSHLRVQSTYTGLRNAGVLPVTGRAVNHGTSRFGEQWIIPPAAAIEFSRVATNSTVGPRLTPARAVIANVRLTPVHWGDQPRPLFEAPGLAAVTMMPATTVSAGPAVGAVSLMRLPMPAVQEMSGGPRPALCAKELRGPAAVAVLKRTAPLPWPGYPVFSFTGYEALDFDDDNTCVLAGAVEPGPLAPVLPRGLTSAPQVRVIGPCEPLVCVVEAAEGSQPAIRPGTMVAFTLEPELVVMPASVSPEMEQEAYAIAAGESVQPRLASRGGLRLFR